MKPSGSKKKREQKIEAKQEEKQIRSVAISSHQKKEGHQTVLTSPIAITDAVFSPKPHLFRGETPVVALDCEMVGVEGN